MKITFKLVFAVVAFSLCCNISAQNQKIAHISMDELIMSMPEYDSATVKLERIRQDLINILDEMQVEFKKKQDELSKNQANMTEIVKQARNEELASMYQRIQAREQSAQETIQQEEVKLMQPILEKSNKAIEAVAKEQGVSYVISANPQIILYKAVGTLDLLPLVKKHLGITK